MLTKFIFFIKYRAFKKNVHQSNTHCDLAICRILMKSSVHILECMYNHMKEIKFDFAHFPSNKSDLKIATHFGVCAILPTSSHLLCAYVGLSCYLFELEGQITFKTYQMFEFTLYRYVK